MSDVSQITKPMMTLHKQIRLIDDLLGGTQRMRDAGQRYLFKMELESNKRYQNRLNRSTLYPALAETLSQMTGRVFFKPIMLNDVHHTLVETILPDVDLSGNNLDVFASRLFYQGLAHGVVYCLVDYTQVGTVKNLAEEKALGARPYLVKIDATDVLGFKSEMRNGKRQLVQFRYRETVIEPDGEFGEKAVEQVCVYEIGRVRKFRKTDGGFTEVANIELKAGGKPLDFIPIVPFITKQTSQFMVGEPPLTELAHLNVKHWQSQSDQDNILNIARVPILVRKGVEPGGEVQISGSLIDLPSDGDLLFVEISGHSIGAGQESLKELESQMRVAGAKLLDKTVLAMTVEQARDEQGKEISQLRLYANRFEDALDLMLEYLGHWIGIAPEQVGNVAISGNIDSDFDPNLSMDTVLKMQAVGTLSQQSTFEEAKKRGLISDTLQWEEEQARLQAEGFSDDFTNSFNQGQGENTVGQADRPRADRP